MKFGYFRRYFGQEKDWDAALADALTTESLGLADSKEPLATMCAADQIPAQLIFLEARLRLTQHLESGMEPEAIHDLLQTEIDRLVLMSFHELWPKHRQIERRALITLLQVILTPAPASSRR